MPISTLEGYPRIGGVIGYGPVGGSGVWKLQERYALADDFYDDVSLLLKMNGANGSTTFLDSSQFGHAVTANGNAAISTTESKFGGSSAYFDGTGDYLDFAASPLFDVYAADFTAEMWIYPTDINDGGTTATRYGSLLTKQALGTEIFWGLGFDTSGQLTFTYWNGSATQQIVHTTETLSINTWSHVGFTYTSSGIALFVNGVYKSPTALTGSPSSSSASPLQIGIEGRTSGSELYYTGYIDSLRITKGQARYIAAFTPPQRDFLP